MSAISGTFLCHLIIGRLNSEFLTNGIGDSVASYSPLLVMLRVTLCGVDDWKEGIKTEASLSTSEDSKSSQSGE